MTTDQWSSLALGLICTPISCVMNFAAIALMVMLGVRLAQKVNGRKR